MSTGNDTTSKDRKDMEEIRVVHPLVARWLTQNGYTYVHEYKMPDYGRVDFYATHSDGHTLLVEAKFYDDCVSAMFQIFGYGVQISSAKLAIAAPSLSLRTKELAQKYNILAIEVGVETPENLAIETEKLKLADEAYKAQKPNRKRESGVYSQEQVDYVRAKYPELSNASADYVIKHHIMTLDPSIPQNKAGGRKVYKNI